MNCLCSPSELYYSNGIEYHSQFNLLCIWL